MKSHGPPSDRLRSPQYTAMRGARLTDARIDHYIRQGRYGTVRQQALLDAERSSKPVKRQPSLAKRLASILPPLP